MAVSLPTAADVRKVREQAAQNVVEQAEVARTPLLAVLGAGDYAVATVSKAVAEARTRAAERREFVAELPGKLTTDELRKLVADLRAQAESTYEGFAERGEKAWGKIRKQPQVKQAIATIESYTEKLDARVDVLVDDAHDAAEKALSTVTRQTRSTGEKVARGTQKFAAEAAETVAEVSTEVSKTIAAKGAEVSETVAAKGTDVSKTVAAKGAEAAATITEAGDEAAHETRSVARKAANRTAPKAAVRKPATRRTTVNGSSDS